MEKRLIFFDLPYWCKVDVRYCIDVMRVEKMFVIDKTKDGVNARLDLVDMSIRQQLALAIKCLRVTFPILDTCVNEKLKISWFKSHDCHVLMQQLLPVAILDVLPKNVSKVLTRLCLFFNAICSKIINL
ncbi:hypothetical protein CR513_42867, partial [Mucuna pruriens]